MSLKITGPSQAALSATYARVFTPEAYNPTNATDWTTPINNMLAAVQAAGGGICEFQAKTYRIDGIITLPNDGDVVTRKTPRQVSIKWRGKGAGWVGLYEPRGTDTPATVFDLRGTSSAGLIQTFGTGLLEIEGIQFSMGDVAGNTSPLILTTNTTLDVRRCSFIGNRTLSGKSTVTDAIVLGGTIRRYGKTASDAFGGYGARISNNFFSRIRAGIVANVWAESNVFDYNMFSFDCGGAAPIQILSVSTSDPSTTDIPHNNGNMLAYNRVAMANYDYGVLVRGYARGVTGFGNTFWDNANGTAIAAYRAESDATGDARIISYGGYSEVTWLSDVAAVQGSVVYAPDGTVYGTTYYAGTARFDTNLQVNNGALFQHRDTGTVGAELAHYGIGSGIGYLAVVNSGNPVTHRSLVAYDSTLALGAFIDPSKGFGVGASKWIQTGRGTTASRPAAGTAGDGAIWKDSTRNQLIFSDATNWRDALGVITPQRTQAGSYNIVTGDNIVVFNATSATASLPDPTTATTGRVYTVKNIAASTLTVNSQGTSKTIDGAASTTLGQWAVGRYTSDGTQWLTV